MPLRPKPNTPGVVEPVARWDADAFQKLFQDDAEVDDETTESPGSAPTPNVGDPVVPAPAPAPAAPVSLAPVSPAAPAAEEPWVDSTLPAPLESRGIPPALLPRRPGDRDWTSEYLQAREHLGGVAARAAERRATEVDFPSVVKDPEMLQMIESRMSAYRPWKYVPDIRNVMGLGVTSAVRSPTERMGIVSQEDVDRYQAEQQLRKTPPTEGAVQLSGVGPGTEEQKLVKAVEPRYRTTAPGPVTSSRGTERDAAQFATEPWWSPLRSEQRDRPEGTSWFIPPEPDAAGFDKVKVRERLLAPATPDISGKMHFSHTQKGGAPDLGVESEGAAVFSEGDISLPRLEAYRAALVAEQAEVYARYGPEHGWRESLAYRPAGSLTASMEKELRRLDADINRVEELKAVLEKIAEVAGIPSEDIGEAINVEEAAGISREDIFDSQGPPPVNGE